MIWLQSKIKYAILLPALLLFAASAFAHARAEGTDILHGDINADGTADAADVTALLHMSVSADAAEEAGASEAAQLARYLFGCISVLPLSDGESLPASLNQTRGALARLAESAFYDAYDACLLQIGTFKLTTYERVASQYEAFQKAADALNEAADAYYDDALRIVCRDLREMNIPLTEASKEAPVFSWEEAAALYRAFGADTPKIVADALSNGLTVSAEGARFTCALPDYETLISCGTREQLLTAKFTLAYLNTVFTDDGALSNAETPALSEEYIATLGNPLPGCLIKNGWCLPRSGGTRLHMGTDIRANRNTPILSVTDGTVLYIGFSSIPGYYVIVVDPYGYEYHYYHMVKQSDLVSEGETVKRGQTIGLVGSTGNSVANHLHLAIVSPEHVYLNPYEVFRQAGFQPLRADG